MHNLANKEMRNEFINPSAIVQTAQTKPKKKIKCTRLLKNSAFLPSLPYLLQKTQLNRHNNRSFEVIFCENLAKLNFVAVNRYHTPTNVEILLFSHIKGNEQCMPLNILSD